MTRVCTRCRRPFTPADLARRQSRDMEAERRSVGLEGVQFMGYRCPICGMNDIFVEILPLAGPAHAGIAYK